MASGSGTGTPVSSGTLWADSSDGDLYFASRHGVGTLWSDLGPSAKTALLTTAQAVLQRNRRWKFLDQDGVALAVSQAMKDAVCEQAMLYLMDPDEDRRAALRAQGVVSAGLIQETFAGPGRAALAPRTIELLRDYEDPYYNVIEYE